MKQIFKTLSFSFLLFLTLSSCETEIADDLPVDGTPTNTVTFQKQKEGSFAPSGNYIAQGKAQLGLDNTKTQILRLDSDFKTSYPTNTVTIFLSTEAKLNPENTASFTKISLITKDGLQDFKLSGFKDEMRYVVIWCDKFDVQFGLAELK
jgi:hypothetical protein